MTLKINNESVFAIHTILKESTEILMKIANPLKFTGNCVLLDFGYCNRYIVREMNVSCLKIILTLTSLLNQSFQSTPSMQFTYFLVLAKIYAVKKFVCHQRQSFAINSLIVQKSVISTHCMSVQPQLGTAMNVFAGIITGTELFLSSGASGAETTTGLKKFGEMQNEENIKMGLSKLQEHRWKVLLTKILGVLSFCKGFVKTTQKL